MSTATSLKYGHMSPGKWRVLNRLFYAGLSGYILPRRIGRLMRDQDVSIETLRDLESGALIVFRAGEVTVDLADLGPVSLIKDVIDVRLTTAGYRRVTDSPANNVIMMLGQSAQATNSARNLRTEGEIDDDCLKAMEEDGLIEGSPPLKVFARLPDTFQIKLTRKGSAYFPR